MKFLAEEACDFIEPSREKGGRPNEGLAKKGRPQTCC